MIPPREESAAGNGQLGQQSSGDIHAYRVVVIAPTCFYYQVALFRELASNPRIDLTVYFCSDEANLGDDVLKKFGTAGKWGTEEELLAGYQYKFLRNYSPWPSYMTSVIGLVNVGVINEILKDKPQVVILMSWMNPTWWLAILACLWAGIPILYLTDQNVQRDLSAPLWKRWIKKVVLGKLLFRLTAGFLCAGTANKLLYEYYGVPESKLVPFAFSWGFDSLLRISGQLKARKKEIRSKLGIAEQTYVILYCGRLSPEKNPMLLLQAYEQMDNANKALAIVGDGALRQSLEDYAIDHHLQSVYFFGFRDRNEIPEFYAIADVLVLPSDQETWGIVVNEALCFGLPVIVSDQVGAGRDLVHSGYNGYNFPRGDIGELARKIQQLMDLTEQERSEMEARSIVLITAWSDRDLTEYLDRYLDFLYTAK